MAENIKLPSSPSGTPEQQLQQMYSYLYQMAQTLNVNLKEIGNAALTDDEMELMNRITASIDSTGKAPELTYSYAEAESLKSLIIKTAQFVKDETDNIRAVLFGEESAEGQYGNWKRKKGLRVDVTPDGVKQTYSYAEIVQGLKTFEINAKNYIKTGFLRTENMLPVYGVAIGKDVVTFAEDGTETYNDSNKVAELTADALSFYQGGNIVAKYTGSKLSFYIGGSEIFYIQSGKIYCAQDLELASGRNLYIDTNNIVINDNGIEIKSAGTFDVDTYNFKLSSSERSLIIGEDNIGKWTLDDTGLKFETNDPIQFQIAEINQKQQKSAGVFYSSGKLMLVAKSRLPDLSYIEGAITYEFIRNSNLGEIRGYFRPDNATDLIDLGKDTQPFNDLYIKGKISSNTDRIILSPHNYSTGGLEIYRASNQNPLILRAYGTQDAQYHGELYGKIYGPIVSGVSQGYTEIQPDPNVGAKLEIAVFRRTGNVYEIEISGSGTTSETIYKGKLEGTLDGAVLSKETTKTDLNNITENGHYWITVTNSTANKPNGLQNGTYEMEVNKHNSGTQVNQRIYANGVIYERVSLGTWYKFTGTAA